MNGPARRRFSPRAGTAGGQAISRTVSARIDLNGFYLIQNSRPDPRRQGGHSPPTASSPGTARTGLYKLFSFDSLGYYAAVAGLGQLAVGKALVLVRGSLRGNARHVYEMIDDNSYSMKIQFSPDAEGWADVLTGVYRRIALTSH